MTPGIPRSHADRVEQRWPCNDRTRLSRTRSFRSIASRGFGVRFSEISAMTGRWDATAIPRRAVARSDRVRTSCGDVDTLGFSHLSPLVHFPQAPGAHSVRSSLRARGRATLRAIRRGAQSRAPDLRSGPLVATTTPSGIPTSPLSFISLKRRALTPFDRALRARGRATLRAIRRGAQSRRPGLKSR